MRRHFTALRSRLTPQSPEASPAQPAPLDREALDNRNLELLLGFLLAEGSNCVDVGANERRFLSHMRQRAPRGRHFAWEPVPHLAARLRAAFPDVEVHQAAVGDTTSDETSFIEVKDDPAYSGLRARAYPGDCGTEEITVRVERLDGELPAGYVPTLIKIDVEGGEFGVLRGASETIVRHRPMVVFEPGPGASERYGTTPSRSTTSFAASSGCGSSTWTPPGRCRATSSPSSSRPARAWNYVARG